MKSTCTRKCKNYKKRASCPNYMKSMWKDGKTGEVGEVEDCAPKRTVLMLQDLHNRLIAVQQAVEESRNAHVNLTTVLNKLLLMGQVKHGADPKILQVPFR